MEITGTHDKIDGIVLLVGVSGAGKSHFLNKMVGHEVAKEGHDIDSETQRCSSVAAVVNDETKIVIIDTPGFNDSRRSDEEIFEIIATFLATQHMLGLKLYGIIYFQKITDNKLSGDDQFYLSLIEQICGPAAMSNVVLATTMWSEISDPSIGFHRAQQLRSHMSGRQSATKFINFDGSTGMAQHMISKMVDNNRVVLRLQEEMCNLGFDYDQTTAGKLFLSRLNSSSHNGIKAMEQLDKEIKIAEDKNDKTLQQELKSKKKKVEEESAKIKGRKNRLRRNPKKDIEGKIENAKEGSKFTKKDIFSVFIAVVGITVNVLVQFLV